MYRVFNQEKLKAYPPPYSSPPKGLSPEDYEVSQGTSYYDFTYTPPDGDGRGAMMEFYQKRCLPIFPIKNDFTCAFVSLGNKAYFLTYEEDRPADMPECCLFSPKNHPPPPDFISHLPYNAEDSQRLEGVQAYSLVTPGPPILFGYAFHKEPTPDAKDPKAAPYRHPQSFYFSGCPDSPANAPMVSQNYVNFRMERPGEDLWRQTQKKCQGAIPACQLFDYKGRTCGGSSSRMGFKRAAPSGASPSGASQSWDALKR